MIGRRSAADHRRPLQRTADAAAEGPLHRAPACLRRLLVRLAPGILLGRGIRDPHERGYAGELVAARWLRRRGCSVLARRLRTGEAELDLVVLDGGVLVGVEVKTGRRGPRWSPGMRVAPRQVERLQRATRSLARFLGRGQHRVDLVEVCLGEGARPVLVRHRDLRAPLSGPSSASSGAT